MGFSEAMVADFVVEMGTYAYTENVLRVHAPRKMWNSSKNADDMPSVIVLSLIHI